MRASVQAGFGVGDDDRDERDWLAGGRNWLPELGLLFSSRASAKGLLWRKLCVLYSEGEDTKEEVELYL